VLILGGIEDLLSMPLGAQDAGRTQQTKMMARERQR
jgi:hypothetical protein